MKNHFETSHAYDDLETHTALKSNNENQGGFWSSLKSNKKFLYGIAICLACTIIILAVLLIPRAIQDEKEILETKQKKAEIGNNERHRQLTIREDHARMTREAYNKTFAAIDALDLSETPTTHRKLLQIHVPVGPMEFQRRTIVRAYQFEPYKKKYDIDFKFVIGEPNELYRHALKLENDTYGDIMVIPKYQDSREAGRTTKSPEFYQYMESITPPGSEYRFVGRLDSDAYVDFDKLFSKYFNSTVQNTNTFVVVSAWLNDLTHRINRPNDWPQGSFYIFSWKMMLMYNRLYRLVPRELHYDDELIGRYVYDTKLNFVDVHIDGNEAFDYDARDWKRKASHAVRVHELKKDEQFIRVALDINDSYFKAIDK